MVVSYILPSGRLYATYHLLGEPETTIDYSLSMIHSSFKTRLVFVKPQAGLQAATLFFSPAELPHSSGHGLIFGAWR